MHVVVVGCGRVGSELALGLVQGGHTVAIVDKERTAFRRLPDGWGGQEVVGYGFDRDHLEEAGIRNAGALAAVTSGDNSNILSARIARETYEVPSVVARIYDPRRAVIYQRLGIPTVATVPWTTDQVMRRLFPDEAATEWADASGQLSMIERMLPDSWAGRPIGTLNEDGQVQVVAMQRGGQSRLLTNGAVGQEGDVLYVAVTKQGAETLESRLKGAGEGGHH